MGEDSVAAMLVNQANETWQYHGNLSICATTELIVNLPNVAMNICAKLSWNACESPCFVCVVF